ncbi:MAG: hypothetical protein IKG62_04665, partial [Lachnospiraceae bacterium]|nr:hypothetical protein [Lachnospiraceae bacterium]
RVYDSARREGLENSAYVELFGNRLCRGMEDGRMKKLIAAGIIVPVLIIGLLVFTPNLDMLGLMKNTDESLAPMGRHYVLITNGENDDFWMRVYDSARREGLENSAYVELFGSRLSVDYSRNELLKIARRASVDGIIVEADEDAATQRLIDEIVNAGSRSSRS